MSKSCVEKKEQKTVYKRNKKRKHVFNDYTKRKRVCNNKPKLSFDCFEKKIMSDNEDEIKEKIEANESVENIFSVETMIQYFKDLKKFPDILENKDYKTINKLFNEEEYSSFLLNEEYSSSFNDSEFEETKCVLEPFETSIFVIGFDFDWDLEFRLSNLLTIVKC